MPITFKVVLSDIDMAKTQREYILLRAQYETRLARQCLNESLALNGQEKIILEKASRAAQGKAADFFRDYFDKTPECSWTLEHLETMTETGLFVEHNRLPFESYRAGLGSVLHSTAFKTKSVKIPRDIFPSHTPDALSNLITGDSDGHFNLVFLKTIDLSVLDTDMDDHGNDEDYAWRVFSRILSNAYSEGFDILLIWWDEGHDYSHEEWFEQLHKE